MAFHILAPQWKQMVWCSIIQPESPSTDQITTIDWKLQPMGWIRLTTTTMGFPSDNKETT